MSILIKGMDMPQKKNGTVLIIYPNGKAAYEDGTEYEVIQLPPHGRLGDLDLIKAMIMEYIEEYGMTKDENGYYSEKWCAMKEAEMVIQEAPTVIPADKGAGE